MFEHLEAPARRPGLGERAHSLPAAALFDPQAPPETTRIVRGSHMNAWTLSRGPRTNPLMPSTSRQTGTRTEARSCGFSFGELIASRGSRHGE